MGLLGKNEIESLTKNFSGWVSTGMELTKIFEFPTFSDSMIFVNEVAQVAEGMVHFPQIEIMRNKVKITTTTPSVAGITDKDLEMVKKVENAEKSILGDLT